MLINLSSDNIYILTGDNRIDISRGQLERHISQTILDIYHQHQPSHIYIINGPGSFTNLRLGCLAINLMMYMLRQEGQIIPLIYQTDKITIYNQLPKPTSIYIGQKNNYRILQNGITKPINIKDLNGDIYMDDLSSNIDLGISKALFDFKNNNIYIDNLDITGLFEKVEGDLKPNYMMEPNTN